MRHTILAVLVLLCLQAKADWSQLPTGINDHLNDVQFWDDNYGIVIGNKGIYYTSTGGNGAAAWTRFSIPGNPADDALYNRCKFTRLVKSEAFYKNYVSGYDTVNMQAVIFAFQVNSLSYSIVYTGAPNTRFNAIGIYGSKLFAAGNNGLLVQYVINTGVITQLTTNTTNHIRSLDVHNGTMYMAGDNLLFKATLNTTGITNITLQSPGLNFNSIKLKGSTVWSTTSDSLYKSPATNIGAISPVSYYNASKYGPLSIRGIAMTGYEYQYYLLTGNGIFAEINNAIESYPSSLGNKFNGLNNADYNQVVYACGDNGLLMKSNTGGGATRPFLEAWVHGGCRGDDISLNRVMAGSGSSCSVAIYNTSNNALVASSSGCNPVYNNWNFTGNDFLAQYWVSNNNGGQDSVHIWFSVQDSAILYQPVTIDDSVLCKSEPMHITITSAQPGYEYFFMKSGENSPYASAAATSSNLDFYTNNISASGQYYVAVQKPGCFRKPQGRWVPVVVEQTHGALASEYINAPLGTPVHLYARTRDAAYFNWSFDNSASITSTTLEEPVVSFNAAGEKFTTLISESINGCKDTSILKITNVVDETGIPDDCFSYNIPGVDPNYNVTGFPLPFVQDMEVVQDGVLVAGGAYQYSLRSATGDTLTKTDYGGALLAKYSKKGTLLWRVYSKQPWYNCSNCNFTYKPGILDVQPLANGDMVVGGNELNTGKIFLNNGDSTFLMNGINNDYYQSSSYAGFVAELTAKGTMNWKGNFAGAFIRRLKRDNNGNIWLLCRRSAPVTYQRDGDAPVSITGYLPYGTRHQNLLVKLDAGGHFIAATKLDDNYTNSSETSDLAIDSLGNVWLTGYFEYNLQIYNSNGSLATNLTRVGHANPNRPVTYVVKFDSLCNYVLHNTAVVVTAGSTSYNTIYSRRIATDRLNNVYLLGMAEGSNANDSIYLRYASGAVVKTSVGGFFLMKLDNAGLHQWTVGSRYADSYSDGHAILVTDSVLYLTTTIRGNSSWSGNLVSSNGALAPVTLTQTEFLFAAYGLDGKLFSHTKSNTNPSGALLINTIRRDGEYFYFAGQTDNGGSNYRPVYPIFNHTVNTIAKDGFFTKVDTGFCGVPVTVLPVQLLSFEAIKHGNEVRVLWRTASEVNVGWYDLQSSTDGVSFTTISRVNALNTGLTNSYNYIDHRKHSGKVFYRLKIAGADGSHEYSKVVAVNFSDNDVFTVSPNPATGYIFLSVTSGALTITEMNGKLRMHANKLQSNRIDIAHLESGVYVVTLITASGERHYRKLVKL